MTSVPYPTFQKLNDTSALMAVGRCRIQPSDAAYQAIVAKCREQGAVDPETATEREEAKKMQKKFMKHAVALASDYLRKDLQLDVSIIDVEIVITSKDVLTTNGCIASCLLDAGCARVVIHNDDTLVETIQAARIPRERLMVHVSDEPFRVEEFVKLMQQVEDDCHSISIFCKDTSHAEKLLKCARPDVDVVFQMDARVAATPEVIGVLSKATRSDSVLSTISLIDPTPQQLGQCYAACLKTDRTDGLFSTVVCTRSGEALGLVYSSTESIVAALECGRGVYYSRSRSSLWRKGDTSGHYQTLHRIDVDCDGDALRFTVTQQGFDTAAFCHLNTLTCWGQPRGLRHLEETLQERLKSAPEGSYTKRLFDDQSLLQAKLVEEAQELAEADTKEHVAEELADILYFAMVRAAKMGVSIDDAVAELDRRTRKVTRRQGDSKAFRIAAGIAILEKAMEDK
jgi:phosphoribosyl-ATP pyrophosphohydrolase / phosphoribosyl-AMP cyclohydrolase / histidinol dehydrogenase